MISPNILIFILVGFVMSILSLIFSFFAIFFIADLAKDKQNSSDSPSVVLIEEEISRIIIMSIGLILVLLHHTLLLEPFLAKFFFPSYPMD